MSTSFSHVNYILCARTLLLCSLLLSPLLLCSLPCPWPPRLAVAFFPGQQPVRSPLPPRASCLRYLPTEACCLLSSPSARSLCC